MRHTRSLPAVAVVAILAGIGLWGTGAAFAQDCCYDTHAQPVSSVWEETITVPGAWPWCPCQRDSTFELPLVPIACEGRLVAQRFATTRGTCDLPCSRCGRIDYFCLFYDITLTGLPAVVGAGWYRGPEGYFCGGGGAGITSAFLEFYYDPVTRVRDQVWVRNVQYSCADEVTHVEIEARGPNLGILSVFDLVWRGRTVAEYSEDRTYTQTGHRMHVTVANIQYRPDGYVLRPIHYDASVEDLLPCPVAVVPRTWSTLKAIYR